MATNTLNVRMKQAVRTEAEWTSDNPVLLEGEVAYSSDKNNMYKVGDGTKTWSQLSYNIASTSQVGGIKVGSGLSIAADGTLSSTGGSSGESNVVITYSDQDEIIYITTNVTNGDEVSY